MKSQKPAIMSDVARLAGVSHQTVSRVLNHHPSVAEHTRKKVLKAMEDLHYRPNLNARSLVTKKTSTLGVVRCGSSQYGPAQVVYGIEQAARERGYHVMVTTIAEPRGPQIRQAIDHLLRQQVEGILLITPLQVKPEDLKKLLPEVPCVLVDAPWGTLWPTVGIDQVTAARKATRHLLEFGHQHIAFLSGPMHWSDARGRLAGWQQEMEHAGLGCHLVAEGDWSAEGGFRAACTLLGQKQPFTAVVCANDQMALGAIRALKEAGLRVPEDVSIVGFDDLPEAGFFAPPLTTVKQNFLQLGKCAVTQLLEQLHDPTAGASQNVIQAQLVCRQSVRDLRPGGFTLVPGEPENITRRTQPGLQGHRG